MTPSNLKSAREWLGLSQLELASKLGVNPRTLAGWEAGERNGKPVIVPRTVELAVLAIGMIMGKPVHFRLDGS